MIIAYSLQNGQVVKTPVGNRLRESHESPRGRSFHEGVLNTYYQVECEGKLTGRNAISRREASRIKAIHMQALAEGR